MEVFAYEPLGFEGELVRVEVDIRRGIPGVDLVGLAAAAVRESKERVRAAIRNSGFGFPQDRVLINLAPSDLPKLGSSYDLPIALKLLATSGMVPESPSDVLALGELTLDGMVRPVRGVLPAVRAAVSAGLETMIVAAGNRVEAEALGAGRVHEIASLSELPGILSEIREHRRAAGRGSPEPGAESEERYRPDFSDFRGHPDLLRALTIVAAGRHDMLIYGPPGSGKTMAARRFPSLLPNLDRADALELSVIRSLAGTIRPGTVLSLRPPFRSPHHSATMEGMVGGGRPVRPGEISLAHKGVLFLDETPEFGREVLQALREPMEEGEIGIVRAGRVHHYPADFQLILAANLCPCGNMGRHRGKESLCVCSDLEIQQYWRNLGGPLLDRIDVRVQVEPVDPETLLEDREAGEADPRSIPRARDAQARRNRSWGCILNSELPTSALPAVCALTEKAAHAFSEAVRLKGLSARACHSILKVARTIADIDDSESTDVRHILEAVAYRIAGEGLNGSGTQR